MNVELLIKCVAEVDTNGLPVSFFHGANGATVEADGDRFNVVNKSGNLLIKGATKEFLDRLREKKLLVDVKNETLEEMYERIFKQVDSNPDLS